MWRQSPHPNELWHHGTKGQKWGKRRWQNKDGSLTPEGYIHYGYGRKKGDVGSDYASRDVDQEWVNVSVDYLNPSEEGGSGYKGHYRTSGYAWNILKAQRESGDDSNYKINGKYQVNNSDGTVTEAALKKINLGQYGQNGYTNNCTKCSATMAMQQMGYNCSAGGSHHGYSYDAFGYWFNGDAAQSNKRYQR